ncbi:MAG: molybdopterin-binding protein [Capsulimonadaceae bacterium]|nr:molybdopterin-binding protein [Capsulimonadaceae bacterium]
MRRQIVLSRPIQVGIVTVATSDELLSNVGLSAWQDSGGLALEQVLPPEAFTIVRPLVVHGGKQKEVERMLKDWCEAPNPAARCDLILTLGGDGPAPRDIMPDALRAVVQREIPGLAEMLRQGCQKLRPGGKELLPAALSRATAGCRARTLIVNIPGCYAKPAEAIRILLPILPEALMSIGVEAFESDSAAGAMAAPD